MLHPSYTELMDKINNEENRGEIPGINSRYSIVIATAKRARQLVSGAKPLEEGMEREKPLSIAVKELYDGKTHILSEDDPRFMEEESLESEEESIVGDEEPANAEEEETDSDPEE